MIKKVLRIFFAIALLIPFIIPNNQVQAKTLNDIYNELDKLKTQKADNENKKNQTTAQLNKTKQDIMTATNQIAAAENGIRQAENEIQVLNVKIAEKDKQIKDLMRFLQISNGESDYLEYAFGAQTFTDFIYRMAVVEQLSSYNDKLLKQMNSMIVENEHKKVDLKQREISLANQKQSLAVKVDSLGADLKNISEISVDVDTQIKSIQQMIKSYESMGCKRPQDLNSCARTPLDTGFLKPIVSGYVTSEWGPRWGTIHYGMDLSSGGGEGANIYPVANGRVSTIYPYTNCGGNMVFVNHVINGKSYTSGYFHLLSVNVKIGDVVTKDTVIGAMGGGPTTQKYDHCTTGAHLHFSLSTGNYTSYNNFIVNNVNPRSYLWFPTLRIYWSKR